MADRDVKATPEIIDSANVRFEAKAEYYSHLRPALLSLADTIPKDRVLEIGCGTGESLQYLKRRGAQYTVGVELRRDVAEIAKKKGKIDAIFVGDIETLDLPFPSGHFDLVVAGFVLEHVKNPWAVTKRLVSWLRPGGALIGSLPNVRHWSVVAPLIFLGRWQYLDEGIMDWTHFRFFTRRSISQLLAECGLVEEINQGEIVGKKSVAMNIATLGLMSEFFAFAYNFRARKPS